MSKIYSQHINGRRKLNIIAKDNIFSSTIKTTDNLINRYEHFKIYTI